MRSNKAAFYLSLIHRIRYFCLIFLLCNVIHLCWQTASCSNEANNVFEGEQTFKLTDPIAIKKKTLGVRKRTVCIPKFRFNRISLYFPCRLHFHVIRWRVLEGHRLPYWIGSLVWINIIPMDTIPFQEQMCNGVSLTKKSLRINRT